MKTNFRRGFTLIELLMVVALIGILATIVMAVLGNAKTSGEDKAVASNLHTVITQAELFLSDNDNSYLPAGGATFDIGPCPTYNASGTNMFEVNEVMAQALGEAVSRGSGSSCYNSTDGWAVAVGLKSDSSTSWCVDNTGTSKLVNSAPGSAINETTFVCN